MTEHAAIAGSDRARVLERARADFLATGVVPAGVREVTARSWLRSHRAGVSPSAVEPRWVGGPAGMTALLRAAGPVIDGLFGQLGDSQAATVLADADAVISKRWTNDPAVLGRLDAVHAAPGFSFDESIVGTTAIGTVIEEDRAVDLHGGEHYSETFREFAAVGAPIRHPVTGKLKGVVDLVLPDDQASSLMLALIVRAAEEISARLLSGYSAADRCLLEAFLRADRRGPRVPTIALNSRMEMANNAAAAMLGSVDRMLLWEQVLRARRDGKDETVLVVDDDRELPVRLVEERNGTESVGVIVQLCRGATSERHVVGTGIAANGRAHQSPTEDALRTRLPGRSVAWRTVLRVAAAAVDARKGALIIGEAGVGKRALARAMLATQDGDVRYTEFDARDCPDGAEGRWLEQLLESAGGPVPRTVVTHLEGLPPSASAALLRTLDHHPALDGLYATFTIAGERDAVVADLAERFPFVIDVAPLGERGEDIVDIAQALVGRASKQAMRIEPRAVHRLMEREWPGNARQLGRVLEAAMAAAPGSVVRPDDLPESFRDRVVRGEPSRLRRVERETIREALRQTQGNKRLAAAALGVSRSTLYRKLEAYGLAS